MEVNQVKILMPVGMEMIMVVVMKKWREGRSMEVVYMWWDQTMEPMMEMEYMAIVMPRGE